MENILSDLTITTAKVNGYILSNYNNDQISQVFVFEQAWDSTARGFSSIGGSSITFAWTHVIQTFDGKYHVFFNGYYAYSVKSASEKFLNDLVKQHMEKSSKMYNTKTE
jgi:hypothetical protein